MLFILKLTTLFIALHFSVDGGWTKFGRWSECSASCGGGTQTKTRTCTNPAPAYDGTECVGEANETQICNDDECPTPSTGCEHDPLKFFNKTCTILSTLHKTAFSLARSRHVQIFSRYLLFLPKAKFQ